MAVRRQYVEYPLNGGLDTKTDDKFVAPPKCIDLVNGVFTKDRTVQIRDGYVALGDSDLNDTSLSELRFLDKRRTELTARSFDKLYSYSSGLDKWKDQGGCLSRPISSQVLSEGQSTQITPVSASNGTIRVTAWVDSTEGGVYYNVTEHVTGQVLTSDTELNVNGTKPLIEVCDTYIILTYVDTSTASIDVVSFSVGNLNGVTYELQLPDLHTDYVYDITFAAWNTFPHVVVGYKTTDSHLRFVYREPSGAAHATYPAYDLDPAGFSAPDVDDFIAMTGDRQNQGAVVFWNGQNGSGTEQMSRLWLDDGERSGGVATWDAEGVRGTVVEAGGSGEWMIFIWEDSSGVIYKGVPGVSSLAAPSSYVEIARGVQLAGKATRYTEVTSSDPTDEYYIPVTYNSTFQSTLFLLDSDGNPVVRAVPGQNNGHWPNSSIPKADLTDDVLSLAMSVKKRIRVADEQADGYTQPGVHLLKVDHSDSAYTASAEAQSSQWFTGGSLWQYDGARVVEAGFWFYPEVDLTQFGAAVANQPFTRDMSGTANAGANTYQYYVVYEWTDAQGKLCQSLALPFTLTNMADPGSTNLSIDVPALPLSRKSGVRIAVYRTHVDDSDSFAYRLSAYPSTAKAQNSTLADVTITDSTLDSALKAGETFYQTIGLVGNSAPVGGSIVVAHDDRLVYVNPFNPREIRFSNRPSEDDQPGFSEGFRVLVPAEGGDITALGSLDDKLAIFKRDRVYVLLGDGPTNTGLSDYGVPALVATDTGCRDQRSLVRSPAGLMFQSDKGIYLLGRNPQVTYVGGDVEAYNDLTIRASSLLPDDNAMIFLTNETRTLYTDYEFGAWSTFENHAGLDAIVISNDYYYLRNDGATVYKRDSSVGSDNGSPITLELSSPWYRPEASQKLWRCLQMNLLGRYISDHDLNMDVYVNYRPYRQYRATFDVSDGISGDVWGPEGEDWGDGDAFGITDLAKLDNVYQYEHAPKVQKVESIRFVWSVTPPAGSGKACELAVVALDVGLYEGSWRNPAGKKV